MRNTRVSLRSAGLIAAVAVGTIQVASARGQVSAPERAASLASASVAAASRCREPRLRITSAPLNPGLSHHGLVLRFKNRASVACTLKGYPGVEGFSAQGHRNMSARRTRSGYLGGLKPRHPIPLVHLAPGKSASALLEWVLGPIPGRACPAVKSLKVTPPAAQRSVRLAPASLVLEGRMCDAQIHPVVPGTSGRGG